MKPIGILVALICYLSLIISSSCTSSSKVTEIDAARNVIESVIGEHCKDIDIRLVEKRDGKDCFSISASEGNLIIEGSSASAICYAFNHYLKNACHSMVSWGGEYINLPEKWTNFSDRGSSPYQFRYFLNVCTFGYSTPFWNWERWSKELNLMALRGVNMPLASVASEAIARRVWVKMGLTEEQADSFFTGPAHLPWHRMGNLNSYDGPLNSEWHKDQIELQHKILDRMRELGMEPIAPAFAGFIPPDFLNQHPEIKYNLLSWGGFDPKYNACVLAPDSPYFHQIGALFIQEWEAEFGKAKYFLSDSFNEMRLPVNPSDTLAKHAILAQYGEAIYNSIIAGDPDAVWVTQGWTFGYQHDFWDKASMQALLSRVPDDRMIIIDLGNDYPKWIWHTDQTWKVQEGFYGKQWIFSYVPNFGGKVLPTGELDMYASMSATALHSDYSDNLVGFGSAPEGVENNEIIYELLGDMGWTNDTIDLDKWINSYCTARYGCYNEDMKGAWGFFRASVYSGLYSYPRFTWQTVVPDKRRISTHSINDDFGHGVELFLKCSAQCENSQLYINDAIEFTSVWLGEVADRHYEKALSLLENGNKNAAEREFDTTIDILSRVDTLLAAHPYLKLSNWIDYASAFSNTDTQRLHFQSNSKRLITTWGGFQEDYSARLWSGLISDYYIPRLEIFFSNGRKSLDEWEEKWIQNDTDISDIENPNPVHYAKKLIKEY